MAVELTSEESAKVATRRLSPKPDYFDASSRQETPISDDFEAFIILQSFSTLASTVAWLNTAGFLYEQRLDRNAVAFEALIVDSDDRAAIQTEVEDVTAIFEVWRNEFIAGKFSDVPEVGLIIRDAQAMTEQLFVLEERMKHLENVQARVSDRLRQDVSSNQLREIQSWPKPLLSYPP